MVEISKAFEKDFADCWDLLMRFREKHFAGEIDPRVAARALRTVINDGIVLLATEDDTAVGIIIGQIIIHPMMGGIVAQELAWYSESPRAGIRLLEAFERQCKHYDVDYIGMSTLVQNPDVGKLLQRRGYEPIEIGWRKDLN